MCTTARRNEAFLKICPTLYLSTNPERLPRAHAEILRWSYGPRGMVITGPTGSGKTRSMWLLLKRLMVDEKPERKFMWFDCVGFSHAIALHYRKETAEEWLEKVANVPLLFFDDLGKLKLTERAETELFGVIDRRISAALPILATTNDNGDSLAARMTENRGPAMIRRLREFCEVIAFQNPN